MKDQPVKDTASLIWGFRGAWGLSLVLGLESKVGSFPAVGVHEWTAQVAKERSCRKRQTDLTGPKVLRKKFTRFSPKPCRHKSLKIQLAEAKTKSVHIWIGNKDFYRDQGWKLVTSVFFSSCSPYKSAATEHSIALVADEGMGALSNKTPNMAELSSSKK